VEDANLVHTQILDYLHRDVQAVMTPLGQSWPNLRAALQAFGASGEPAVPAVPGTGR